MNRHDMNWTDRLAACRRGRAAQGRARRRRLGAGTAIVAGGVIAAAAPSAASAGTARFPRIDLALLRVIGLAIRPAFNRQAVMPAEQAAGLAGVLGAQVGVPFGCRSAAGPVRDWRLLQYDGTPGRFAAALTSAAPAIQGRFLEPGEPLVINGAATAHR